jgi:cellulose biosynthesis protein BcsQ
VSTVLATYNIKGGVGKTSAAVNLAHQAAAGGARVLLWDPDPQGAATYLFRVKPRVKGGGKNLVRGRSDVDRLVRGTDFERLDLLPASLVSESVFEAADVLLVPIIPATLSSRTFQQLRDLVAGAAVSPRVMAFFSMVDGRKRLHRDVIASLAADHGELLHAAIPSASDVERMGERRTVLERFAPRGRAAEAYRVLWHEISERLAAGVA